MKYIFEEETYQIRGCLMNVYKELGSGFLEKVYQEALEIVFQLKKIPYIREKRLDIYYRGMKLTQEYIADFVCFDNIIVELKSVSELTDQHRSQVFNYLKATNFDIGLLVNFGESSLKVERLFNYRKSQK